MSDTEASADEINRDMETEEDNAADTEEEPGDGQDTEEEPGDGQDTDQEDPGLRQEASPKLKKSPRPNPKKAKQASKAATTSKAAPGGDGKKSKKTYEEMQCSQSGPYLGKRSLIETF